MRLMIWEVLPTSPPDSQLAADVQAQHILGCMHSKDPEFIRYKALLFLIDLT